MANLSQKRLDTIIRKNKGPRAVEEMVYENEGCQCYLLDDGAMLTIDKRFGNGFIVELAPKTGCESLIPGMWVRRF